MKIKPFRPLTPSTQNAAPLICAPYDTMSREEARRSISVAPRSFLNVVRADALFPDEVSAYDEAIYRRAETELKQLIESSALTRSNSPSLFLYKLRWRDHEQIGVVGLVAIDDYEGGKIKIHELTRPDKERDRIAHICATEAQCEAVILSYRGQKEIDELVADEQQNAPLLTTTAGDVQHSVWKVSNSARLQAAFSNVSSFYIADGHHRCEAARQARATLQAQNTAHTGTESYNFILAVIFPADQTKILPYNRLLNYPSTDLAQLLKQLQTLPGWKVSNGGEPSHKGEVRAYISGHWHAFQLGQSLNHFDVASLQTQVIEPFFGIRDVRTDQRINFVGGIRGTSELKHAVDSNQAQCAFSMFPVSIAEIFAASDRGEILPPKSTWFEPKLASGLFISPFKNESGRWEQLT